MSFHRIGMWGVIALLIFSLAPFSYSENVSAGTDHYWIGTTTASTLNTNWDPATVPNDGDNIYFSAASLGPCSWTLTGAYGSFNLLANFTSTVTQASSFSITSYSQAGGTFTGSASYILTNSGDWVRTAGTVSNSVLKLTMTGTGGTLTVTGTAPFVFNTLRISGDTTITAGAPQVGTVLTIDSGKTLTLNSDIYFSISGTTLTNSGVIAGGSTFRLFGNGNSGAIIFGVLNAPLMVYSFGGSANSTITIGANTTLGSILNISTTTAYFITLDLSISNFALSATDITIGTKGIFNGRASTITCSGNWDSSAGTFTAGTSTLVMSGTTKTAKTANTNGGVYNLQVNGTITTSSSVNVSHSLTIDSTKTFTIGASKTVDLNCSNGGTYSNLGTIVGTGTMEYSFSTADKTLAFGVVNAPVRVRAISTATANRTLTLSSDIILGSTLLVNSDHASNTMTIDARAVYLTSTGATTIGTRGNILYATFSIITSPGWGGGVQTGHSYTYDVNLTTTATPGEVWILTTNATWLDWDLGQTAIYGTPDSIFGGHWYWVNISVSDGLLTTYQNYTVLVVPIETMQDYIPLILALVFGLILMAIGIKIRLFWLLAGPAWILFGITIFMAYDIAFMFMSVGLGLTLLFMGAYNAIR